MISIIVCSVNYILFEKLTNSISDTIGSVPYEIIRVDNKFFNVSINSAYNIGIDRSHFSILVFVHEDVLFHTLNWGERLLSIFKEEPNMGLLGVAGSKIRTKYPTGWWENDPDLLCKFILQHYPDKKVKLMDSGFNSMPNNEVVILDGVFMAMRKNDHLRFDERLDGFHFYDQSISLITRKAGFKVMVTNQILIEHLSYGTKDGKWFKSSLQFQKLYANQLPQTVNSIPPLRKQKLLSCRYFLESCRRTHNRKLGIRYWLGYLILSRASLENLKWARFFLKFS